MRDLIARIEAATGPDRELGRAIFAMIHNAEARPWRKGARSIWWFKRGTGETLLYSDDPPAFTASLDAALTLVPEGCGVTMQRYWLSARVSDAPVWSVVLNYGIHGELAGSVDRPTPSLALCAAALRARLAMQENADAAE